MQQHSRHHRSEGHAVSWVPNTALKVVAAAVMATSLTAGNVWALALGRASVQSVLGEPLRAEIDVPSITDAEAASLQIGVAPADRFQSANMQLSPLLSEVRFELVRRPDGRFVIRLTSERVVSEPFLDVLVQANWSNGQLLRGYTLLIDPPNLRPAPAPAPLLPMAPPPVVLDVRPATPVPEPVRRPATTPAAIAPASAPSAPSAGVEVQRGDTAGGIARQYLPAGVSLDQMLIALLRANPDAFINNNVNRLRAGAILQVPDAATASSVPAGEARQLVQAQSRDFNEYRRRLAGLATTQATPPANRQAQGSIQTQIADQQPTATAQDRLQLAQGATAAPEADKIAQTRQAEATRQRTDELNRNLQELQQLKSAASSPATPATAATAAPAEPATATAAPAASEPAAPPAESPAVVSAPAPAPAAPPPAIAPASDSPSLVDTIVQHPLALPAAGGLAALLGVLALLRLRRRRQDSLTSSENAENEESGQAQGQTVDTSEDAPVSSMMYSPSQLDAGGDVDPVAEADVYLAYGRDKQAEEILVEAVRLHPERLPARLKLLEIHAQRNDLAAFNEQAEAIHALTGGEGPEWEQAREWGLRTDPDNALYRTAAVAAVGAATVAGPASIPPDIDLNFTDEAPAKANEPDDLDALLRDEPVAVTPAAPAPSTAGGLDFDLDLTELSDDRAQAPAPAAAPIDLPDDVKSLSLDLDTALGLTDTAAPAPAPAVSPAEPDLMAGLELDETMGLNDPLQTKLSLAEEFQAIGDTDGARSLAEEVEAEASGELKAKARAFLSQLS